MKPMFQGKAYGIVTIGERGQLVIPAELRKTFKIKTGDQLMVFAKNDIKMINMMPCTDFSEFITQAKKMINRLGSKMPKSIKS